MMSHKVWMVLAAGMLCAPMLCSPEAALAEKVGVAAAVEPDAFSGQGTPLKIGKSVFYNERISTSSSGLVQVLLVDGSTFTVGPGSSLVIDKFVYNPNKKTGEMVATFSKGTMRFVGGRLSKNDGGVRVKTPAGQLAIRGGIVQAAFGRGRSIVSFIYGDYAQLTLPNGRVLGLSARQYHRSFNRTREADDRPGCAVFCASLREGQSAARLGQDTATPKAPQV